MKHYVFVADEMGTPGMAPGTSNSFVFGGYVINENALPEAIEAWRRIKSEMCGGTNVELKWKHFFVDANHPDIDCPLLVKDRGARRNMAALALDYLFHNTPLTPVIAVSRKNRATEFFVVQSKKGKDKIDDDLMWMGPVAQFALFLSVRQARGRLWFDRLGSEKHEARRQAAWSRQLQTAKAGELPLEVRDNYCKILAIDERIEFLDSANNEAVQIADFVCGVIWQAAEGDEAFLTRLIDKYGPNATRQGLGILHIA